MSRSKFRTTGLTICASAVVAGVVLFAPAGRAAGASEEPNATAPSEVAPPTVPAPPVLKVAVVRASVSRGPEAFCVQQPSPFGGRPIIKTEIRKPEEGVVYGAAELRLINLTEETIVVKAGEFKALAATKDKLYEIAFNVDCQWLAGSPSKTAYGNLDMHFAIEKAVSQKFLFFLPTGVRRLTLSYRGNSVGTVAFGPPAARPATKPTK
jgi:hypothetical protein